MSDSTTQVTIENNTAEEIAYRLFKTVAFVEGKALSPSFGVDNSDKRPDRQYIIDTYAECLEAVKDPAGHMRKVQRRENS